MCSFTPEWSPPPNLLYLLVTLRRENVTAVKQRDPYINIKSVEGKTQMVETSSDVVIKTSILIATSSGLDRA